ncbi:amino acid ABC transporter permease [Pararhizobium sp. YC-54]|uniref:amino acid ABC transporter permease n=1 Tax=Pararhizobium sp. YC-54 TaxID=2986920 RepID=UPI0021F72B9C|nr:amino acid ABC transporter permease [Pararhizobium sp. YC-54]MCW0001488.1 amino acid ABC transporter permease [Pararhizobium sp. YC-54]
MDYQFDFSVVTQNFGALLQGLLVTAELWVICAAGGATLGVCIALARLSPRRWLSLPSLVYVQLFRNTPVLIQLIWFYYAFPIVVGQQLTPFVAVVLGLGLNTSAYCAEIFRGGIISLTRGQWEGAKAIGMSQSMALRRVIMPQVFRRMLPALTNRVIEVGKMSSLASVLSVPELMYQGRLLSSTFYRPFEVITTLAIIYFLLIFPSGLFSRWLEVRMARGK